MSDRIHALISCFYGSTSETEENPPVGFSWTEILASQYERKYILTMLLHGECLKYGLKSEVYKSKYGTINPYSKFLKRLYNNGVRIIICNLCLTKDGFNSNELLGFIKPISFSIDYILQYQVKCKHFVVYDAKQPSAQ